ncbi:hypothetical protein DT594_16260 [Halopseudomonas laoshanensis]|uniref:AAA+ ATPase domain-containing protein n=1 Tax=Halopseudomonas laoshanensis TaxID=2268758 RepID=A0A7V7KUY5_9GAMM|nr:ATP-binding protein [Halopseudomonas laoshanensis]KAA0691792.1 hypothetical protein DT594_16260 [Halopseudomonas laoshanensis]
MTRPPAGNVLEMKISHRQWTNAFKEAFAVLTMASAGDVVCIVGPSRAGKSRLIHELRRQLENGNAFTETGLLPVICVEAVNAGPNGAFSTKAFTLRLLEAVRHPMLSMDGDDALTLTAANKIERSTESILRQALERALKHRGVRYLFIDEAQHVRYASKQSQAPCAVMDSWKCLAQTAGLVLVVVGAYPILEVLRNSPHMLGRKKQIHLSRYGAAEEEILEFAKICRAFEQAMGDSVLSNLLVSHTQYLHERTCGCIGLLKSWLKHALTLAHLNDCQLDLRLLEQTMMSDSDLLEISKEIAEGERLLYSSPRSPSKIVTSSPAAPKKPVGKPFNRNPKRYEKGNRSGGGGAV